MASISRREQLELDELLSDIYRGIETLPDNNNNNNKSQENNFAREFDIEDNRTKRTVGRAYVREYELDESSPLVQSHKRELAATGRRNLAQEHQQQQPHRPSLKRQTTQQKCVGSSELPRNPDRGAQSLATFVTNNPLSGASPVTPEHKRRVRIVEHREPTPEYIDDYQEETYYPQESYQSSQFDSRQKVVGGGGDDDDDEEEEEGGGKKQKVKYVNTNKLIYHQEKDEDTYNSDEEFRGNNNKENIDDLDEATRVEYYHTTWLDRQLGRASRRRSSKELNERQLKEKAMIEELKRSLRSGAITLRQSFKSKQSRNNSKSPNNRASDQFLEENGSIKQHQIKDDYFVRKANSKQPRYGTGLATVPRNFSHQASKSPGGKQRYEQFERVDTYYKQPEQSPRISGPYTSKQPVPVKQQVEDSRSMQFSRTLPNKRTQQHQLLQSHYRGNKHQQSSAQPEQSTPNRGSALSHQTYSPKLNEQQRSYTMRNSQYSNTTNAQWCSSNNNDNIIASNEQQRPIGAKSPLQQQASNTLNRMPSATEVVRSALSRSSSHSSVNQLNKTINLLPSSPPPYAPSVTPTQNLRAASPSLSPSPLNWNKQTNDNYGQRQPNTTIQRAGENGQIILQATRTIGRPPQSIQAESASQQQVYSNPHASLMQHRQEQQMKQPNRNSASIREFNELDSLLRSLSPGVVPSANRAQTSMSNQISTRSMQTSTGPMTQISPGYTSAPSHASLGGFMPQRQQQQQPRQQRQNQPTSDLYAQVHKQPFTIDATNNTLDRLDESCIRKTNQNLSEFEPPVDLIPSMEDYQNISKLNPVQNRYWYKPNMSRDHAISLLKDKPQGTFIVRDSTSFKGAYGLAVKVAKLPKNVNLRSYNDPSSEYIRHFLIEPSGSGSGVRLKGYANEPVFDNLADLIYQHSLTELALPCKLIIPRTDIEDPNFNQRQKQFIDEFLASKEQAKHLPYERTSPNGGYRKYPGNVLVHNEHRIIFE